MIRKKGQPIKMRRIRKAALPLLFLVIGSLIIAGCGGDGGSSKNSNADKGDIDTPGKPQLLFFTMDG